MVKVECLNILKLEQDCSTIHFGHPSIYYILRNVDLVLLKSLTKINYSDVGMYIYITGNDQLSFFLINGQLVPSED